MRTFPTGQDGKRNWLNHPISLTLIAFAFTSVPALLLHKWSEKEPGQPQGDGPGAAHRRRRDVDRRSLGSPPASRAPATWKI